MDPSQQDINVNREDSFDSDGSSGSSKDSFFYQNRKNHDQLVRQNDGIDSHLLTSQQESWGYSRYHKESDFFRDIYPNIYEEEEEESYDSGKEFEDEREEDEDWIEPKYNSEHFVSQPTYYDRKVFKPNALQFINSFGYNSYRKQNLCVINEDTIVFLSGNYIHVYSFTTRTFKFIRSVGGAGFGHCTKHPFEAIIAVGERGIQPLIILYECSSFNVLRVLQGGADQCYNYLCFSPNGKWLLSQSSKPDGSLTVWNWNKERIVLKQRNPDWVFWKAEYNPFIFGGIITAGFECIKFWKLVQTFTGLKLMSDIGNWNEKTFCDIHTFCALPHNMVISVNNNNNLYLWEGDTLIMEISRSNNRPLHDEEIIYLEFKEQYDEIFSVGHEGKYKVWDYTRIVQAKFKGQEVLEIQPTFQRTIKDEIGVAKPMSFQRVNTKDPTSEMYYMQDKQGSIWSVELGVKKKLQKHIRVFDTHDGPIIDIAPSPVGYYIATIGRGGKLHVYNSKNKKLIIKKHLSVVGTSLLWLPCEIDKTASILLIGFVDGTVRLFVLSIRAREINTEENDEHYINAIQAFKPHNDAVTVLSLNPHRTHDSIILSGSDDHRIFLYRVKKYKQDYLKLCPLGFVLLPCPVYSISWNLKMEVFLITSMNGMICEVKFPEEIPEPPKNTFEIQFATRVCHFKSVKSEVDRKMAIDRNLLRNQRRNLHQEKKKAYDLKCLKENKRKLDKLNEVALYISKQIELEKKNRKEEEKQRRAKKNGKDQSLTFKQPLDGLPLIPPVSKIGSIAQEKIEFEEETSSSTDHETAPIETLRNLKFLIEDKKKKMEIAKENEIDVIFDKEFEDILIEVSEKIKEIKQIKEDLQSESQSNQTDSDNKEITQIDLDFILDEIMKIVKNVDFDNLEIISEDEEVPPRHPPSVVVPIYFADYINEDYIWVSPGGYDAGYIYEYKLGSNEPYNCTPITEFENTEMTCFVHVDGRYLIIGQGDGFLKVININHENMKDFSNYWLYAMHDNINGRIKKICLTFDYRYLYSIGEDSNIFFYSVNLTNIRYKEKKSIPLVMKPPVDLKIDDYIAADEPSLEDSVKKLEKEWMNEIREDSLMIFKNKLENMANKLAVLSGLNHGLPESQRLPPEDFILNQEFYDTLLSKTISKHEAMVKPIRSECEKAKIIKNNIYNYFLNPIKTHKIYIYANSFSCKVTTFYQEKLSLSFLAVEQEAENIILDLIEKGRKNLEYFSPLRNEPFIKKKYRRKDLEFHPFIDGEDKMLKKMPRAQKSIYIKIIKQRKNRKVLQNLLRIFKEQSGLKRKEFMENMLYKIKPVKNAPFRLKCDPLYKPIHTISTEKKFYQLVMTKRKIHNLISDFNTQTLTARNMKSNAAPLIMACNSDLKYIALEFKNILWPELPERLEILEPLEFPENIYLDNPPIFPHEKNVDYKYRDRFHHELYELNKNFPINFADIEFGLQHERPSDQYTPWELEFIYDRKKYLMSEYHKKKYFAKELLEAYDDEIRKLATMKVEYEVKICYLKICYLKYFEELHVIRTFQQLEEDIYKKCSFYIKQKHVQILRINIRKHRIKKCSFDILRCFHRCQMIATRFMKEVYDNPPNVKRFIMKHFNKTLARELKRKELGGDEDLPQEEEKSSSSSEIDSEPPSSVHDEIDSDDIEKLVEEQQEEFIDVNKANLEQECGKELMDYTLETREKRYVYERKIAKRKEEIQRYNDEIKNIRDKVLVIQTIIAIFHVKKSLVLEEKHKQLSKIRIVAAIDSSQMQHFDTSSKSFSPMRDNILFPLYTLKNLEAKKRNLRNGILTVDLDKKETLKHIKRLELDIETLNSKLQTTKDEIKREKRNKLGCVVNLPRMEETILRRIVKDYRYDTLPLTLKFYSDIRKMQQELMLIQKSTCKQIKQNTLEQLKLSALLEQKRQYKEIIRKIQSKKQVEYLSMEEISYDIEILENSLAVQEDIKQSLENAIREYKYTDIPPVLKRNISIAKEKLAVELMPHRGMYDSSEEDFLEEEKKKKKRSKPKKKIKHEEVEDMKRSLVKEYKTIALSNEESALLEIDSETEMGDYDSEKDFTEEGEIVELFKEEVDIEEELTEEEIREEAEFEEGNIEETVIQELERWHSRRVEVEMGEEGGIEEEIREEADFEEHIIKEGEFEDLRIEGDSNESNTEEGYEDSLRKVKEFEEGFEKEEVTDGTGEDEGNDHIREEEGTDEIIEEEGIHDKEEKRSDGTMEKEETDETREEEGTTEEDLRGEERTDETREEEGTNDISEVGGTVAGFTEEEGTEEESRE